jgi:thymidylate kinase
MSPDGAGPDPHPLVAQTFDTLDEAGVAWVLLSGDVTLASAEPLELTVTPADAARLGPLLATIGFAPVPSGGRSDGDGQRFLRYDEASDRWMQLVARTGVQDTPASSGARGWAQRLRAVAGAAAQLSRARGRSVALLGPDGSGKSTLARGIAASFPLPSRLLYMGLWGRDEPATALGMVLAAAKRPPKAWLRYGLSQYHRLQGRLVIFDRYPYDAYQPAAPPHEALKRVYFAVLARCCPAPDLVLLIDTPPEVAFERKPEDPLEHLAELHDAYMALAPRVPHLQIIPGNGTAEQVRADAMGRIWRMHLAHWAPVSGEPAQVQESRTRSAR